MQYWSVVCPGTSQQRVFGCSQQEKKIAVMGKGMLGFASSSLRLMSSCQQEKCVCQTHQGLDPYYSMSMSVGLTQNISSLPTWIDTSLIVAYFCTYTFNKFMNMCSRCDVFLRKVVVFRKQKPGVIRQCFLKTSCQIILAGVCNCLLLSLSDWCETYVYSL